MDDALKLKILEWMCNIGTFLEDQIPSFAQEVASYGFYCGLFQCILLLALFAFGTRLVYKFYTIANGEGEVIAGIVLCVLSSVSFAFASKNCIKALVAPKLYVIERVLKR